MSQFGIYGKEKKNLRLLTYELCRFIWPLVNERFKSLLHGVNKLFIPYEAHVNDVIHLIFEVEQLLHHCFVFFWVDNDCAAKSLGGKSQGNRKRPRHGGNIYF